MPVLAYQRLVNIHISVLSYHVSSSGNILDDG